MLLKWRHAGQACITANRVYVQSGIYDTFAAKLADRTSKLVIGHGADKSTTLGPVTTDRSLDKAQSQVDDAISHGGRLILGGGRVEGGGYFFKPTIIADANEKMEITREETFAPVLALYKFETEEEVVEKANNTSMGLASYFFTKNVDRTWRLLENLEAGMIGMNTGNASSAETPFGGIKESGYGKESGKDVAVNEYLITKTGTLTLEGHF
jgi:succinate-semialdehyde dehydrogenase/glutarate-semialdehyde dehydrogenase